MNIVSLSAFFGDDSATQIPKLAQITRTCLRLVIFSNCDTWSFTFWLITHNWLSLSLTPQIGDYSLCVHSSNDTDTCCKTLYFYHTGLHCELLKYDATWVSWTQPFRRPTLRWIITLQITYLANVKRCVKFIKNVVSRKFSHIFISAPLKLAF